MSQLHILYILVDNMGMALTKLNRAPMGMAAIGIALYKYVMKYSPKNCNYFNRDRFVLSNGKCVGVVPAELSDYTQIVAKTELS